MDDDVCMYVRVLYRTEYGTYYGKYRIVDMDGMGWGPGELKLVLVF
jgi:hypothetical protein